jgi:methylthioribose-1-phosphate isomerase
MIRAIEWIGETEGYLQLLDQTRLPNDIVRLSCREVVEVFEAIKVLRVRGAPAIGVAAAYGLVLSIQRVDGSRRACEQLVKAADLLKGARPTAVNLAWAVERLKAFAGARISLPVAEFQRAVLAEARKIDHENAAMCKAIGQHGVGLIAQGMGVLTHCNAGALATSEYGMALAPLYLARESGVDFAVYVDETRPLLQGARLTAWELSQQGINVVLICDSMAAQVMKEGRVQLVIVGADRIAANGDTANKIGTYGVALLAKAHGIPFYVAAPSSTFDLSLANGTAIPIEYRGDQEITEGLGKRTAPEGIKVYNPAFDVTPAALISGIITENGILKPSELQK